jgi:hypothetical protein
MSAVAALAVSVALAGCGSTTYFAGRTLPPSGLTNRVLIAIQNPSALSTGALQIVDAYYDIRFKYNSTSVGAAFSISGYSGGLPSSIQNMPEEEAGAVYGSSDGSFTSISYSEEKSSGAVSGLNGKSASIFITRAQTWVFAASQASHVLTIANKSTGASYPLSLPGIYHVSVNPSGSVALAFVQNSNYVYYPVQLTPAQTVAYSGGYATWPKGAQDCEPQSAPAWCLFQAQDSSGNALQFNRPVKAVFSDDGATAYILSCGPECGGNTAPVTGFPATAAVTPVQVAPMIYLMGENSGTLPTQTTVNSNTTALPGGASNALVDGSTLYVVGQAQTSGYWGGYLSTVNLSSTPVALSSQVSISDGAPGAGSRMALADDDTLWIAMTKCTIGIRYATGESYGCLTMYNTSTKTVTLMPYIGDATGIAAVTGLHKLYAVEAGQVYIYSTVDGSSIDNQYVTVSGTAYDVAYMDALSDSNNTVY